MFTVLLSAQAERDVSAAPRGEDEEVSVSAEELRAIEVDAAERAEENSGAAAEEGGGDDDDGGGGGGGGARPAVPTRRPPMVRSNRILLAVSAASSWFRDRVDSLPVDGRCRNRGRPHAPHRRRPHAGHPRAPRRAQAAAVAALPQVTTTTLSSLFAVLPLGSCTR